MDYRPCKLFLFQGAMSNCRWNRP